MDFLLAREAAPYAAAGCRPSGEFPVGDTQPFETSIPCVSITLQFKAKSVQNGARSKPTAEEAGDAAACPCAVDLSEVDGVLDDLAASPAGYFVCKLHRLLKRLEPRGSENAEQPSRSQDERPGAHGDCVASFQCRVFGTLLDVSDFLWRVGELYLVIQPLGASRRARRQAHSSPRPAHSPQERGDRRQRAESRENSRKRETSIGPDTRQDRRVSFSSARDTESDRDELDEDPGQEPRYVTFSLKEVLDGPTPGRRAPPNADGRLREFDNEVQLDPGDDGTLLWVRLRLEEFEVPYGTDRDHPSLPPREAGDAFVLSLSIVENRSLRALVRLGEAHGRKLEGSLGEEAAASPGDSTRLSLRLGTARRPCAPSPLDAQKPPGCEAERQPALVPQCRFALALVGSWAEALLYFKSLATAWVQLELPREDERERPVMPEKLGRGRSASLRRAAHARPMELSIDLTPLATRVAQHLAMLHHADAFPPGTAPSPSLVLTNSLCALLHSSNHPRQPRRISLQAQLLFLVFKDHPTGTPDSARELPSPSLQPRRDSLASPQGPRCERPDALASLSRGSLSEAAFQPLSHDSPRPTEREVDRNREDGKENDSQCLNRADAPRLAPLGDGPDAESDSRTCDEAQERRTHPGLPSPGRCERGAAGAVAATAAAASMPAAMLNGQTKTGNEGVQSVSSLPQFTLKNVLSPAQCLDEGFPCTSVALPTQNLPGHGQCQPAIWRLSVDLVSLQLRAETLASRRAVYVHYTYAPFGPQHSFSTEPPVDCSSGEAVPLSGGFCAYTLTASPARLFQSLRTTPLELEVFGLADARAASPPVSRRASLCALSRRSGSSVPPSPRAPRGELKALRAEKVGTAVVDLDLLAQKPLRRHSQAPHDYQAYSAMLPVTAENGEILGHLHIQLYLEHLRSASATPPSSASAPARAERRESSFSRVSPEAAVAGSGEKNGLSFSVAYEMELWKRAEEAKFLAELKTRAVEEREKFLEEMRRVENAKNQEIRGKQEALQHLQLQLKQMAQQLQQKALELQSRENDLRSERERCLQLAARTSDEMTGATRRLREEKEHAVQLEKQRSHLLERQNAELQSEVTRIRARLDFLEEENCELRQHLTSGPTAQLQSDLKLKLYQVADLESRLTAMTASRDYFVESCATLLDKLHAVKEQTASGLSPRLEATVESRMASLRSEIGSLRLAILESQQAKASSSPRRQAVQAAALPTQDSSALRGHSETSLALPALPPSSFSSTLSAPPGAFREASTPSLKQKGNHLAPDVPPVPHTEPLQAAGQSEGEAGPDAKAEEIESKVSVIEKELERLLKNGAYTEEDTMVQALRGKIGRLRAMKRLL
uniref:Centrosomal protein of 120 kDa n=1 Tax=Neospora caninum (strain Liverpool) TaxID=572307 RepID=A0A0F7UAJ0_NEOCL|nr:TPA: Centrosomal protein of 120 kDa [Neospora caninum Liverpool]